MHKNIYFSKKSLSDNAYEPKKRKIYMKINEWIIIC
jgi:hypothetical protein